MIHATVGRALRDEAAPQRRSPRMHRRGVVVLLIALALVLGGAAVGVLFLGSLATTFDSTTRKIATPFPQEAGRPVDTPAANGKSAVNILVVGSDSRGAALSQAEAGVPSDQRSDTMLLVHIPADRKNAYVISIMRDTWVPIPGHGTAKINAALAFGGVPLTVETVESLLHQRIDHVALVDFDGFQALTDALGGVEVNVPVPFTASEPAGFRFAVGPQKLTGDQALAFVRERYAFPDGDYQRVRDQQVFIKSLVAQVTGPQTLANLFTVSQMVSQFSPYLTVDSGLDSKAVAGLALELKDVRPSGIISFTLPTAGTGWSSDGQSIVNLNQEATDAFASAMADGTVPQFVAQRNLQNGN